MHAAVDAARQVPQDPAVGVAEEQVAGLGALTSTLDVVENPLDLGAGEVGGQTEATDLAEAVRPLVTLELLDDVGGAHVLPDDRVIDGLAGVLIPHDGGLTLVGDTDGGKVVAVDLRLLQSLGDDGASGLPDFYGVVLHPARVREDLGEFLLSDGDDLAGVVEDDRTGRGGALIDGENELFGGHECPFGGVVTSLCVPRRSTCAASGTSQSHKMSPRRRGMTRARPRWPRPRTHSQARVRK